MFVFLYMTFAFSVCLLECVRKKPSLTKGVVVIEMAEKQQNDERNFDKFLHRTKAMSGKSILFTTHFSIIRMYANMKKI